MCTVLVVDDDPEVRGVIRDIALKHGHKVIEAGTHEEAIDVAQYADPDVIAMDLKIPGSSGFDVLRSLRQVGLHGFAVIISGHAAGHTHDFTHWKELRIFDVVDKPFNSNSLMKKLEAAADATKHEGRLCRFLDGIISKNESSLSASVRGSVDG
jgi:two-component system nitrogen regulation response regulator NtrX